MSCTSQANILKSIGESAEVVMLWGTERGKSPVSVSPRGHEADSPPVLQQVSGANFEPSSSLTPRKHRLRIPNSSCTLLWGSSANL